ncbi:MAG: hypothetical protein K2H60_13865 [Muribaculaceae bacterium]|nr:hypothetical protein [Muribaculaceae bacterium]
MQKSFRNIVDLLNCLYTDKKLLSEMYQRRTEIDFTREEALYFIEPNRLDLLLKYGVIREEGANLELEEVFLHFFEEVLCANEVISQSAIKDQLTLLKESIDFYLKSRSEPSEQRKYMQKVKRSLRNIARISSRNVLDLKRNVDDTFKTERNYEIKRDKLKKYQSQIRDINTLANATQELLDDQHSTFENFSPDDYLSNLIVIVRIELIEVNRNLIELQSVIRDYLNQIERQDSLIKKIRRLKMMKDQLIWKSATNVCEAVEGLNDIFLEPSTSYSLKPSLSFLKETDTGNQLLNEVRSRLSRKVTITNRVSTPLLSNQLDIQPIITDYVNVESLATAFFGSGTDLFNFVLAYPYTTPQTIDQKVEYYSQIVQTHLNKLRFSDEWAVYGQIYYPLIYASL